LNRFPVSETIFAGKLERGRFLLLCAVWNVRGTGSGEAAPEGTGDDEVEAHLLNENLLDRSLLDDQLDL
jgi:hypothetical protein